MVAAASSDNSDAGHSYYGRSDGVRGEELVEGDVSIDATNLAEIFGDVDWSKANLGEMAEAWRKELAELEAENIKGLIDISQRFIGPGTPTGALLTLLKRAHDETDGVVNSLEEYCQQLQQMGSEIAQIEQVNRALTQQNINQTALLHELDHILDLLTIPETAIQALDGTVALNESSNVSNIAEAAVTVHQVLYGLPRRELEEKGLLSMAAVMEMMQYYGSILGSGGGGGRGKPVGGIRMAAFDELIPFLETYGVLLSGLRLLDSRKHQQVISGYQQQMATIFRRDFGDFVESLRNNRLIKKTAEDKPHLFVALSHHHGMGGERLMGSVTAITGTLSAISSTPASPIPKRDFSTIDPFELKAFPPLEGGEQLVPSQGLHYLIISLALLMEQQQSVAARIFYGLDERCEDERLLKLVDASLGIIFAALDEVLVGFVEAVLKFDSSLSVEMIAVLDQRIPQLQENLPVLAKILVNLKRRLLVAAEAFINEQVNVIEAMKFSSRKRSGVFPFVSLFPSFILRTEESLATSKGPSAGGSFAREIVNKGYEKITAAIFRSLDALALQAEQSADEKERINASVMNIQNTQHLVSQLTNFCGTTGNAVEASLRMASSRYDRHLNLYATLSLHRVFGRLMDFFEDMNNLLATVPPDEVAFHPNYNKASARRILGAFSTKEIRKGLELVYGRVVKHFEGDVSLQRTVWRIIQEEFLRENKQWEDQIRRVYPATGGEPVQLLYSLNDVLAYFGEIATSHHMT